MQLTTNSKRKCGNSSSLFDFPDPRRIASRPLACRASTIADGAAVPSTEMSCSLRLAVILLIPTFCQANDVHRVRPSARTTQAAERPFNVLDAGFAGHGHRKCGFKRRHSHCEPCVSTRELVTKCKLSCVIDVIAVPTFALKCNAPSARSLKHPDKKTI
jgi:hypothetical protein